MCSKCEDVSFDSVWSLYFYLFSLNYTVHSTKYKRNIMLCFHVKVDKSLNGNRFSQKAENVPVQIHTCRLLHVKTADHKPRSSSDQMFVHTFPKTYHRGSLWLCGRINKTKIVRFQVFVYSGRKVSLCRSSRILLKRGTELSNVTPAKLTYFCCNKSFPFPRVLLNT